MWNGLIIAVLLSLAAVLWTEVVRDLRHWLAHVFPKLMPKHAWHHRVFRPDLTVIDPDFYRQAQWHHDVPEAVTMMLAAGILWAGLYLTWPAYAWTALFGLFYATGFLLTGVGRANGWAEATDLTHQPGPFEAAPSRWLVNRTYHWRHHFDNTNAYYCGTFTLVDQLMGTSLSLKGKRVAVTGASGSLGRDLLTQLHQEGAKVTALTSRPDPITLWINSTEQEIPTIQWQIGREQDLAEAFSKIDILILNHGINVNADRSPAGIEQSYEINTFSHWRLMELFLTTVRSNADIACKEIWVNTSEAEVLPAVSPLYELSKRTLGDLVTLRRLDAPCVIRKLILGPFKSNLNPVGVMSSQWVAKQILKLAKRDVRNIIVTIDPLTFFLFPWKEFWVSTYFRLFSRSTPGTPQRNQDPTAAGSFPAVEKLDEIASER
jgi:hypothetical protein